MAKKLGVHAVWKRQRELENKKIEQEKNEEIKKANELLEAERKDKRDKGIYRDRKYSLDAGCAPLRWDSVKKFLIAQSYKNKRLTAFWALGFFMGLRMGDIRYITKSDLKNRYIKFSTEKTGDKSFCSIPKGFYDAMKRLDVNLEEFPELLFESTRKKGEPISKKYLSREFKSNYILSGIEPDKLDRCGTHMLRKTFARHFYDKFPDKKKGEAIMLLQSYFNHSTARITMLYIGLSSEEFRNVKSTFQM